MRNHGIMKVVAVILSLMFGREVPAREAGIWSAGELLDKIRAAERQMHDLQMHFRVILPSDNNRLSYEFDWAYEQGKEYYGGTDYRRRSPDVPIEALPFYKSFDGEKMINLRFQGNYSSAVIASLNTADFATRFTPNTLLGYRAKELSRESFGEAVSRARSITVRPQPEAIQGRLCYVIEAIDVERDPAVNWPFNVRAWVDTERGFRLLRFEKHYEFGEKNRWKVPACTVDKIELQEIDGIWFPVSGELTVFGFEQHRPPGMNSEAYAKLRGAESAAISDFETVLKGPPRRIEIVPESIRINKGIPPERFRVKLPPGCEVYDQFLQTGYVVGDPPKDALSSMNESRAKAGTPNDASATPLQPTPSEAGALEDVSPPPKADASKTVASGGPSRRGAKGLFLSLATCAVAGAAAAVFFLKLRHAGRGKRAE